MTSQTGLEGKTVIITGAAGNIGHAFVEAFAEEGARLFLMDLTGEGLQAAEQLGRAAGAQVATQVADVTDPEQVASALEAAEARFGPLEVLINNAGIQENFPVLEYPLENWRRVLEVNVTGVFICAQAALRRMVPRRQGRLVNMASIAGRRPSPVQSAYNTSKHAVIGLTRCLALEAAPHNIRVNAICPGLVESEMFSNVLKGMSHFLGKESPERQLEDMLALQPDGRLTQPSEVARLAVFLASTLSSGINGQAIPVDGGRVMV